MARKRVYVVTAVVCAYVLVEALERRREEGSWNGTTFDGYRAARYDVVRALSYGVDVVEDGVDENSEDGEGIHREIGDTSFARCVRYIFYPPLRQVGPVVFYRDFERRRCDDDFERFSYAAREIIDSFAWFALISYAGATFYDPSHPPLYPSHASVFEAVAYAWTRATVIWAAPTIIFNLAHSTAVVDGQIVPRDVSLTWPSSATSFTRFWRNFHVSLHHFYVFYVHRRFGPTAASACACMAMSLLFHGIREPAWWMFFIVNTVGVVFERNFRRFAALAWTCQIDHPLTHAACAAYQCALFTLFVGVAAPSIRQDSTFIGINFCVMAFLRRRRGNTGTVTAV
jgi:D-alanyl-lipoteichoic acid acyltransferase DltB (MBOAT superfamily)